MVKHAARIKVWGGVSAHEKTNLHIYKGTIDAKKYFGILEKMKPEAEEMFDAADEEDWIFQHDGASAHKAIIVKKWVEDNVSLLVQLKSGLQTQPTSIGSKISGPSSVINWRRGLHVPLANSHGA